MQGVQGGFQTEECKMRVEFLFYTLPLATFLIWHTSHKWVYAENIWGERRVRVCRRCGLTQVKKGWRWVEL